LPYRTLDNVIEGVVLTFTDITDLKKVEEDAQAARDHAESIVDTIREPLIVLDGDLTVTSASRSFYSLFGVGPKETVGRHLYELGNRQWDVPRLRELLDCFPNLYTDIGFGFEDYLKQGMERISKDPRKFTEIFTKYSGRIMFATDLVIDASKVKTQQWIADRFKTYMDMLTQQTYTSPVMPGETLKGLALPPAILERVLYKNYEEFVKSRPKGTKVQPVSWTRMKMEPLDRRPGQTFPPKVK
jgi:PAS domain-containing protein